MDGLLVIVAVIAALVALGLLASAFGVDSRDSMPDDRIRGIAR
jgi:hypothetical protein